jgi:hypothetical protein
VALAVALALALAVALHGEPCEGQSHVEARAM